MEAPHLLKMMANKLKTGINNNKKFFSNIGHLTILQFFIVLAPLLTYPYLIRVLGASLWGEIILCQSIISYFSLLISFGFDVSSTKNIAVNINNKDKIVQIVSSTIILKSILLVLSIILFIILVENITFLQSRKYLYYYAFTTCIGEWLFPIWYYQGTERIKTITLINVISRTIFLILIFILIKNPSDYLYVPLLTGLGSIIGGGAGLWMMISRYKIKIRPQKFDVIKNNFKDSFYPFLSKLVISFKDKFSTFIIAKQFGTNEVALFDLGMKLMGLFSLSTSIINQAAYPKFSRDLNTRFYKKIMISLFIITIVMSLIIHLSLGEIINTLIDESMFQEKTTVHILLISPLFFCIGNSLGMMLNGFKKFREIFIGMILTTLFYLALLILCQWFYAGYHLKSMAIITLATYIFEAIYRYIVIKKYIA